MLKSLTRSIILKTTILLIVINNYLPTFIYAENSENFKHLFLLSTSNTLDNYDILLDFIKLDEEYLNSSKFTQEDILNEINLINDTIYENKKSYEITKKGSLIYGPNQTGNIHILKQAQQNRINLLNKSNNFKYNKSILYFPKKAILGRIENTISNSDLKIIEEEVINILNNIEIENDFLKNIIVSITPFKLKGIKAFTEVYGNHNEGITIVIGYNNNLNNLDKYKLELRKTLLHELGHVLHYKNTFNSSNLKDRNLNFWKEYNNIYDNNLDFTYDKKILSLAGKMIRLKILQRILNIYLQKI